MPPEVLDVPFAVDFAETSQESLHFECSPIVDQLSAPIVGKWNVLISQTNWEKGMIILQWRNELIAAEMPNTAYSDESWSRRVGNISPQHVGKLRRVSERFDNIHNDFSKLYWSHFNAALDWDDAELWLEGAVQNDWSVAQMQAQRWETNNTDENKPQESEVFTAEIDEDEYALPVDSLSANSLVPDQIKGHNVEIGVVDELGDSAVSHDVRTVSEPHRKKEPSKKDAEKHVESADDKLSTGELLMSLKGIAEFPADLAESLELLKVSILNHKLAGWKSISADQVSRSLDAIKMLITAND